MMRRIAYSAAIAGLLPWAAAHLLWRSRRQPEYRKHWGERFGFFAPTPTVPTIWLHAVSVGETRAAQPLVAALRERYPGFRILMSHMTPTGRATSEALFGDSIERVYLPYDTPWAVGRFLRHFRPAIGIVMETEIWPNLVAACRHAGIPLMLANARLSEKSARRYARFPELTREALRGLSAITTIGSGDIRRLTELGATGAETVGSMKFDILPPAAQLAVSDTFRQRAGGRPVFLCASTREGEEALLFDAWKNAEVGDAVLAVVPRHPQRFDDVAAMATACGLGVQRRSDEMPLAPATRVWLGDSMGEMFAYYAAADIAFVGGSLLDFGSQNLIEPCAVGTPVLLGPSTYNFPDAAREALACGAAQQVATATDLVATAVRLLGDDGARQNMGTAGKAFTERHRGATARNMAIVARLLGERSS